jgi:4-amino-4-deoxy-L-arabinose transferase-like glycosyltransferase
MREGGRAIERELKYDAWAALALLTLASLCPIPLAVMLPLALGLLLTVAASRASRRPMVAIRVRSGR